MLITALFFFCLFAAIFCAFTAGYFDAKMDAWQYSRTTNYWYLKYYNTAGQAFYFGTGGNEVWNPTWPWTADFWHRAKHCMFISWSIAAGFACLSGVLWLLKFGVSCQLAWFVPLLCFVLFWAEGFTITYFWHYRWEIPVRGTFWDFIKEKSIYLFAPYRY